MRNAIAMFPKVDGLEGALAIDSHAIVGHWLREWGREKEADELQAGRDEMIVQATLISTGGP